MEWSTMLHVKKKEQSRLETLKAKIKSRLERLKQQALTIIDNEMKAAQNPSFDFEAKRIAPRVMLSFLALFLILGLLGESSLSYSIWFLFLWLPIIVYAGIYSYMFIAGKCNNQKYTLFSSCCHFIHIHLLLGFGLVFYAFFGTMLFKLLNYKGISATLIFFAGMPIFVLLLIPFVKYFSVLPFTIALENAQNYAPFKTNPKPDYALVPLAFNKKRLLKLVLMASPYLLIAGSIYFMIIKTGSSLPPVSRTLSLILLFRPINLLSQRCLLWLINRLTSINATELFALNTLHFLVFAATYLACIHLAYSDIFIKDPSNILLEILFIFLPPIAFIIK
ncbi:hypothetical protein [Thermonema sp.]|uniref:hypothetical protein n=1 Tax=Thermonema sp. TaxID=2231181 RepID=UPI0035B6910D